jgi:hypothetical protein
MVAKYFYGHIKIFNGVGADFTTRIVELSMVILYYMIATIECLILSSDLYATILGRGEKYACIR